ncbi:hypothetical protein BDBG_06407 [Blastomyces gilchristii SLH14081]|uniref:Uncharacterized protein n=1 Tax=Blastomyces gilchristii (strain SLH14081) TaxID=559298 RepID=A0A179UR55_BLAGS|nr:uncharacterized protein BDBG_06407 [Blastomyces gilchristii SLH14081]OAT10586.1 hypothetical protein BDBG_06407 [Blastomyces gilchristii SLH14081]
MSQNKAEPTVPLRNPRWNLSFNLTPASRENEADHSTSLHHKASSTSRARNQQISEEILITHLDHVITSHGGKTASIKRLPGQISQFKNVSFSPQEELVDLKHKNSQLQAELAYHEKV